MWLVGLLITPPQRGRISKWHWLKGEFINSERKWNLFPLNGREGNNQCTSCLVVAIVDAPILVHTSSIIVIAWTVWHRFLTSRTFASSHTALEWCQRISSHSSCSSDTCKDWGGGSHMCAHIQHIPLTIDTDTHIQPFTDEGGWAVTEMSES